MIEEQITVGDVRSLIYHVNIQNAVREYLQPQPCFSVLSEDIFPGSFEKHPKYYSKCCLDGTTSR